MNEKFFIGCTHFFHTNMLKFVKDDGSRCRPFDSLEEMHEYMIKKWNSVVKPKDYVYHLGDVTFQYHGAFNNLMSRLNGQKRLIIGNHDKIWNPSLQMAFVKAELWKGFSEGNFTCSHIPLPWQHLRDGEFNVHAHVHWRSLTDPHYLNVSCEVRDYTPVHYDEIIKEIECQSRSIR